MWDPEPESEYKSEVRDFTPDEEKFLAEAQSLLAMNWEAIIGGGQKVANQLYAEDEELEPLFKALKAGRESHGISLEDMAARLQVRAQTLDRFEQQQLAHPSITIIQRYAKEVGSRLVVGLTPAK